MFGDRFDFTLDRIGFFVKILLTKAKQHVEQEERFHKVVEVPEVGLFGQSKCWVQGVSENIVARDDKHDDVEAALPSAIFFDNQEIENTLIFIGRSILFIKVWVVCLPVVGSIHVVVNILI